MKIWFPTLRLGTGTDVFTMRLAEGLQKRGIDAEITWFDRRFEFLPDLLRFANIPPQTDLVHANSWNAFAFQRAGVPLVVTEHLCVLDPGAVGWKSTAQSIYHATFVRCAINRSYHAADALVAVGRFVSEGIRRAGFQGKIAVISNSVDAEYFCPGPRAPINNRQIRLLFSGNLTKRKGGELLAPLMRRIGSRFMLRYTAGLRSDLTLPESKNCEPLGRLNPEQMRAQYQWCDALLLPSRFEGLPLAALESMACGKPVIGFAGQALDELVEPCKTGWLAPINDIDALAAICRSLTELSDADWVGFTTRVRERICSQYAQDLAVSRYVNLYRRLLQSSHGMSRP
jgi:starch synthase